MSIPDHTDIVLRSISSDVAELQQRMEFYEIMLSQVIEALAAAGIITMVEEESEVESPIVEP
jgi:2-phospho-L-lactate guanylyltransferase (CobY/MobA/RfbA family)